MLLDSWWKDKKLIDIYIDQGKVRNKNMKIESKRKNKVLKDMR